MKPLLLTLIFLFCRQIYAQPHIKDYLIPEGMNKSVFYMPNPYTGENSGLERNIWFIQRGKSFELLESTTLNGTTGSITSLFIEVSDDKVILTKTVSTNFLGETNRKRVYNPPKIYLKLPTANKKATWRYTETSGDSYNCSSEFSTVEIDGETRSSIKVTKQLLSKNPDIVSLGSTVEQYVLGIGLWQVKAKSGTKDMWLLKEQILDPDVDLFK